MIHTEYSTRLLACYNIVLRVNSYQMLTFYYFINCKLPLKIYPKKPLDIRYAKSDYLF